MHAFLACGVVPPYAAYQGVGTVRLINEELSKCNSLLIQDCNIISFLINKINLNNHKIGK